MVSIFFSNENSSDVQGYPLDATEDEEFTATRRQEFFSKAPLCLPIDDDFNYSIDDGSVCLIVENPLGSASVSKRSLALLAMATLVGMGSLVLCLLRQKTMAYAPSARKEGLSNNENNNLPEVLGGGSQESVSSPVGVNEVDIVSAVVGPRSSVLPTDNGPASMNGGSSPHAAEEATKDLTTPNVQGPAETELLQKVSSCSRPNSTAADDGSSRNLSEQSDVVGGSLFVGQKSSEEDVDHCSPGVAPLPADNDVSRCSFGQCIMS